MLTISLHYFQLGVLLCPSFIYVQNEQSQSSMNKSSGSGVITDTDQPQAFSRKTFYFLLF